METRRVDGVPSRFDTRRYLTEQPDPNNENVVGYNNKKRARRVLRCCGGFPSLLGLVAIRRGRGWFIFGF